MTAAFLFVWLFLGFVAGASFSLLALYAALPLARRIIRVHVVFLSYSYMIFVATPCLHVLGLWPHDHAQGGRFVDIFGSIGTAVLISAALAGSIGILFALQWVVQRLTVDRNDVG